jgi:Fe(3+) dicitrate transport protein
LPKQSRQLQTAVRGENGQILAAIKYIGEVRVSAGRDPINFDNDVHSRTVIDLSAKYEIDETQQVYAVVDKLLDEEYVATKHHIGIQVGKPPRVQVGYRYQF